MRHAAVIKAWTKRLPPMDGGYIPDPSGDPDKAKPVLDVRWIGAGVFQHPWVTPTARQADLRRLVDYIERLSRNEVTSDE